MTKRSNNAKALAKFLTYVLGGRPDAFGLVADDQGYVTIKALLKALHEEDGWRHIRLGHIREVALTVQPCPIEIDAERIRARDRGTLPRKMIPQQLPKLLFVAVRRRAYPSIRERGLKAGNGPPLLLSSDKAMATRIGGRIDREPVILTVQVQKSVHHGTNYKQYGAALFLADEISAETFTGPALPKERANAGRAQKPTPAPRDPNPGSYLLDFSEDTSDRRPGSAKKAKNHKKRGAWKKARRQERRHKIRQQRHD